MGAFFYILGAVALGVGVIDLSNAARGSHREIEAGTLFLLTPVFLITGFVISRGTSRKCPKCAERIKKAATICKYCRADLPASK